MSTNYNDVATQAGLLEKAPNNLGVAPDQYAYSRLFTPGTGTTAEVNFWRSSPIAAGTNNVPFKILSLTASPKKNSVGGVILPKMIKPGYSVLNAVVGGVNVQFNCLLTVCYMQTPPAGWPAPAGPTDPQTNQGFYPILNPISALIPGPISAGNSIWSVVMIWDNLPLAGGVDVPSSFEYQFTYQGRDVPGAPKSSQGFGSDQPYHIGF